MIIKISRSAYTKKKNLFDYNSQNGAETKKCQKFEWHL